MPAFISSTIIEGYWSFNPTSTASWLILLSFLYHHHHPQHLNTLPTMIKNPAMSPSPLLRDVGSITNTLRHAEWTVPAPAPPLSRGMWVAHLHSTEGLGRQG